MNTCMKSWLAYEEGGSSRPEGRQSKGGVSVPERQRRRGVGGGWNYGEAIRWWKVKGGEAMHGQKVWCLTEVFSTLMGGRVFFSRWIKHQD